MSDETICQKWKNKICQKLWDIENTNGLEEHLSEWSPIVQRRPKNTIYQDYLMMRLTWCPNWEKSTTQDLGDWTCVGLQRVLTSPQLWHKLIMHFLGMKISKLYPHHYNNVQKMKKDQCCCSLCRCTDHPIIKIPHARTS